MSHVSDALLIVISTCGCDTYWPRCTTRCMYLFRFYVCILPTLVSQAFKGVGSDLDAVVELLESIEHFLKRLDIYTKVPPTEVMTDSREDIGGTALHPRARNKTDQARTTK